MSELSRRTENIAQSVNGREKTAPRRTIRERRRRGGGAITVLSRLRHTVAAPAQWERESHQENSRARETDPHDRYLVVCNEERKKKGAAARDLFVRNADQQRWFPDQVLSATP